MAVLKQSTAYTRDFLLVQSADHISGLTGLGSAPVVNLSKAGAAFGAAAGAVSEIGNGWYKVALTTADTGTLGELAYHITGTGADPTDFVDQVGLSVVGDITTINGIAVTVDGNGNLNVNVKDWNGVAVSNLPTNFFVLAIDASGNVAIQSNVKKNQPIAGFMFVMVDAITNQPKTGLAVTATRRQDGGAANLCDNSVIELANGIYKIDLTANDVNANKIVLRFTGAGASDTDLEIVTIP